MSKYPKEFTNLHCNPRIECIMLISKKFNKDKVFLGYIRVDKIGFYHKNKINFIEVRDYIREVRDYIREVRDYKLISNELVGDILASFIKYVSLKLHKIMEDSRSTLGKLVSDL